MATADMDHNCVGNGCRFAGCENQRAALVEFRPKGSRSVVPDLRVAQVGRRFVGRQGLQVRHAEGGTLMGKLLVVDFRGCGTVGTPTTAEEAERAYLEESARITRENVEAAEQLMRDLRATLDMLRRGDLG